MKRGCIWFGVLLFLVHSLSAATFLISPETSEVKFSIKHFRIDDVQGCFKDFSGTLDWDATTKVVTGLKGSISAKSVDTENRTRDGHIRSAEFFNADVYPMFAFASTKITPRKNGFDIAGTFTMHGVTKPITIPLDLLSIDSQTGLPKFSAKMAIKRSDFGVSDSPRLISDDVNIELVGSVSQVPVVKGEKK